MRPGFKLFVSIPSSVGQGEPANPKLQSLHMPQTLARLARLVLGGFLRNSNVSPHFGAFSRYAFIFPLTRYGSSVISSRIFTLSASAISCRRRSAAPS